MEASETPVGNDPPVNCQFSGETPPFAASWKLKGSPCVAAGSVVEVAIAILGQRDVSDSAVGAVVVPCASVTVTFGA